jgi:hypothetical protein
MGEVSCKHILLLLVFGAGGTGKVTLSHRRQIDDVKSPRWMDFLQPGERLGVLN